MQNINVTNNITLYYYISSDNSLENENQETDENKISEVLNLSGSDEYEDYWKQRNKERILEKKKKQCYRNVL